MAEALALFERFSARSKTQETREWSKRDLNPRAKLETPRRIKDPCSWNISQYGGFRSVCPSKGQTASSAILDAASRSRSDAAHRALLESACTPIFRSAMEEHGQHPDHSDREGILTLRATLSDSPARGLAASQV